MPNWIAFADGSAKLLGAITALLWPLLAAVIAWKLLPYIREVLKSPNFSIEVAGLKISAQDFSDQVRGQIEDLQTKVSELRASLPTTPVTTPNVTQISPPPMAASAPRVLWVDDHPNNNAFQIARLKSKNIDVVEAHSTAEAMKLMTAGQSFSAVISDMGRQENGRFNSDAGLELVREMRKASIAPPVFIFTTHSQVKRLAPDRSAYGIAGVTSSSVELFEMLRHALGCEL